LFVQLRIALLNEEVDLNLKATGIHLIVITAGQGVWRINPELFKPTKSRVSLGGLPVHVVSLNRPL